MTLPSHVLVLKLCNRQLELGRYGQISSHSKKIPPNSRRELLAICPPEVITEAPVILGATLARRQESKVSPEEARRLCKATATAMRCKFLPIDPIRKLRFATCTAGAQARYGWVVKRPPLQFFDKLHTIFARIAGEHFHGSPELRLFFAVIMLICGL